MNILLISANTLKSPYPVYPLGLDYVASSLGSGNIIRILDLNSLGSIESLSREISSVNPDLIGLSIRNIDNTDISNSTSFLQGYKEIARSIRSRSKALFVLGGPGFSLFPRELMTLLDADYGIIGEGEVFPGLVEAINNNHDITKIKGIIIRNGLPAETNPHDVKFKRIFNRHNTHVKYYLDNGGMLNLQTKRGCPYKCIYCTYPTIEGSKLRYVPPDEAAETAYELQQAGAKYFFITDSSFNNDYGHSLEVARAFKRRNISIPWGAFFSPTPPPDDYYYELSDAGLKHVEFGSESFSDIMLRSYKKPFLFYDILRSHEKALEAGLYIAHYLMLGGPGENMKTLEETIEKGKQLKKKVLFYFCGIRIYPNTELHGIAIKDGQISESQDLLHPLYFHSREITSDEITRYIETRSTGNKNFLIGSGGENTARIIQKLYGRGFSGPLWEFLIQ